MKTLLKFLIIITGYVAVTFSRKPNIVFILTDDQDAEQIKLSMMPKLSSFLVEKGATFVNAFTASPLCCPSRSGIFTGQYVHNHGTFNNSVSGECFSTNWQNGPEKNTFPLLMHNAGYTTVHVGKYLNTYGQDDLGGISYIPPGWDNWITLQGNSVYYNYTLSINGTPVYHGFDPVEDYLTTVIKNNGVNFIETYSDSKPFFIMLSTPACHIPYAPEERYKNSFNESTIPRTPNFNIVNKNKNWFAHLGVQPLRKEVIDKLEEIYRNRLRTLLTVDDMVESVVQALERKGFLDNTYIIYTSDHGYQLGQFSFPREKSQPYEFDIRVPFVVRGPGISEGVQIEDVTTNIDLAPTILNLAGIPIPRQMDGISLKEVLHRRNAQPQTHQTYSPVSAERSFLVEHSGQGIDGLQKGCEYLGTGLNYCSLDFDCKCIDSKNNSYTCLRILGDVRNEKYCIWEDYPFEEYYDMTIDPYEITNGIDTLKEDRYNELSRRLSLLSKCSGSNCNNKSKLLLDLLRGNYMYVHIF